MSSVQTYIGTYGRIDEWRHQDGTFMIADAITWAGDTIVGCESFEDADYQLYMESEGRDV